MDFENDSKKFKYLIVYEWLKNQIAEGKYVYGSRLPSENMLCNKFNLSRQTIRKAIEKLESDNYIESVKGSGSFVNIKINKSTVRNVGLLITYLDFYIFTSIFSGMEKILSENNIGIDIAVTHNKLSSEKKFLEKLLNSNICALIVEGTKSSLPNSNIHLYRKLEERNIPILFFHNFYSNFKCHKILMNDFACSYNLVKKLVENGHKKIAGIFKFDDNQGIERYNGFIKCLNDNNIEIDDNRIKWFTAENFNELKISKMLQSFAKKSNDYTAVLCYNDIIAIQLIEMLNSKGVKVPDDVSIVSFDDSQISYINNLKIISAIHPKYEMGECIANTIIEMVTKKDSSIQNYSKVFDAKISNGNSIKNIKK